MSDGGAGPRAKSLARGSSRRLDPDKVVRTLDQLEARIAARFPDSGLAVVCADLAEAGRTTERRARRLSRPFIALRLFVGLIVLAAVAGVASLAWEIPWRQVLSTGVVSLAQGLESAVNLVLLSSGAAWFLLTLETRWKRRRVRTALNELRAFAHVVDMHQLTKDPTVVLGGAHPTNASPKRAMSEFQLARYLDYCAEMLALISKLAALYGLHSVDTEIDQSVREIEGLTSDLGRKIWQKITILGELDETAHRAPAR
jgi:hypothetical protein